MKALVACACVLIACSGTQKPPQPSPLLKPDAPLAVSTPRSIPQYRLLPREGEQFPLRAVVSGVRFEQAADGSVQSATSIATRALTGGRRVAQDLGGGFVFWGGNAAYRASSFLAPLEPLAAAPWQVTNVAFGPGFSLLQSGGGQRIAIDETGAEHAIEPAGLIDIEATGDGRVVGLLELGRAVVSTDRGAHYREVQAELGDNAMSLSREPLGFVLNGGVVVGLQPGGKLARLPKQHPKPGADIEGIVRSQLIVAISQVRAQSAKGGKGSELVEALAEGILIAPGQALVAIEAALVRVDLLTGEVLSRGEQLMPNAGACQLVRLGRELLMVCQARGELTIFGGIEEGKPRLERVLHERSSYSVAAGQLLVEGACTGDAPYSVCVRSEGADWRSLRCPILEPDPASAASAGAPPSPPTPPPGKKPGTGHSGAAPGPYLSGYIAREGGGVVALVGEPINGYVDLTSGHTVKIENDFSTLARSHESCVVDASGSLRCLSQQAVVAFDRDGKPEPALHFLRLAVGPGGRALGWADKSHLFQTENYGRSWTEVAPPVASNDSHMGSGLCSEVGCIFDGWMRTGWDAIKPEPREPPEVAPEPVEAVSALPRVVCRSTEAPKLPALPRASYGDSDSDENAGTTWGFGMQLLPENDFQSPLLLGTPGQAKGTDTSAPDRGVAYGWTRERPDPRQRDSTITEASPLSFRYVGHFDPTGTATTATLRLEEMVRAARRVRATEPDASIFQGGSFGITPVMSSTGTKTAGFIVTLESSDVWVNAARTLVLTPRPSGYAVVGAVVTPRQELAVLFDDTEGRTRILRYARDGQGTESGETPYDPPRSEPTPDALAITPAGKLAVLRFPSTQRAPTAGDPAFAYTPGETVEKLAPWTTLTAASDPACQNAAGYRSIVATPTTWLSVSRDAVAPGDDWGTLALVRWSTDRVCLEAVEGAADGFSQNDGDVPTRIVWTLSPKSIAARLGFAGGFELRQAQNCQLLPAPPPAAPPATLLRRPRSP